MTESPTCPDCGRPLPAAAAFCPACGAPSRAASDRTRAWPGGPAPRAAPGPRGGLPPGAVLAGRWRIVTPLGRGGMGEVYRAEDLKLGETVALKFLPAGLAQDGAAIARLHREVRSARRVAHPNVCRVFDIGESDGATFLSMEFIDGEDLASLLRRIGRLPPDKAVEVAHQLCAGLAAAHGEGVVHRDLKPANVMLDGRGRAKITDFGLADLAGRFAGRDAGAGTPAYMAPEQLAGREATARSDLYALGVVLYELFTGRRPYAAGSRGELARAQSESAPPRPSSRTAGIAPQCEEAILRCLAVEPADRPASALQVAALLPGGDPLAAALAAGETPSPEMVAAAPGAGNVSPARVAGLLCLVGILCVAQALLWHRLSADAVVPRGRSPAELAVLAKDMATRWSEGRGYHASGLEDRSPRLLAMASGDDGTALWRRVVRGEVPLRLFWYRVSPRPLASADGSVDADTPPLETPGEVRVLLDPQGRLRRLDIVPRLRPAPGPPPTRRRCWRPRGWRTRGSSRSRRAGGRRSSPTVAPPTSSAARAGVAGRWSPPASAPPRCGSRSSSRARRRAMW